MHTRRQSRLYHPAEFYFEENKLKFLEKLYDFKIVDNDDVAMHMSGVVHKIYGDDF